MAEQQDPEVPDIPEHDLSEEDMIFVSLLYNYILFIEAEERKNSKDKERLTYRQGVKTIYQELLDQAMAHWRKKTAVWPLH